jgi:hypothetical protein
MGHRNAPDCWRELQKAQAYIVWAPPDAADGSCPYSSLLVRYHSHRSSSRPPFRTLWRGGRAKINRSRRCSNGAATAQQAADDVGDGRKQCRGTKSLVKSTRARRDALYSSEAGKLLQNGNWKKSAQRCLRRCPLQIHLPSPFGRT